MNTDTIAASDASTRLRKAFAAAAWFVALLWTVKALEFVTGFDLVRFGVYPRRLDTLDGVLWAPLIHGSWSHLITNTPPLLVLGTALLFGYPRAARVLLPGIYIGTGLAVWLFARSAFHIGASGLTFGVMFFVFTVGVIRWDRQAIALSMIVFFLYGGMIWGVLPGDPSISFETHFFGAAIGLTLAFVLRSLDPPKPRKRYSWEDEEVHGEDGVEEWSEVDSGRYTGQPEIPFDDSQPSPDRETR